MRCRYNVVNFVENPHKRHPIPRPNGRGMGCLLWVHTLVYIKSRELRQYMQHRVILDRVITALDCIWKLSSLLFKYDWPHHKESLHKLLSKMLWLDWSNRKRQQTYCDQFWNLIKTQWDGNWWNTLCFRSSTVHRLSKLQFYVRFGLVAWLCMFSVIDDIQSGFD